MVRDVQSSGVHYPMDISRNTFHPTTITTSSPETVDKAISIDVSFVKSFVHANLHSVHEAKQVAEQLNCALDRLKRTFHESESMTLSQFIRESRLSRMKEQLAQSDLPCKVICLGLGVREDAGARMFKSATGLTMEDFRKLQKTSDSKLLPPQTQKASKSDARSESWSLTETC